MQYTLRNIPASMDRALRQRALREGKSLNQTLLELLRRAMGFDGEPIRHRNLDDIVGTWQEDPKMERALEEQRCIDPDMWH